MRKENLKELEEEPSQLEIQKKAIEDELKKDIDYEKLMSIGLELNNIMAPIEANKLRCLS